MHLPNADRAVVSREKIVGYLLNPQNPDGAPKSQFFTKLGFNVDDWETLANAIGKLAQQSPVTAIVDSAHGTKYNYCKGR
jgi:hypothetical protein